MGKLATAFPCSSL